jgi:hypothetical protein
MDELHFNVYEFGLQYFNAFEKLNNRTQPADLSNLLTKSYRMLHPILILVVLLQQRGGLV